MSIKLSSKQQARLAILETMPPKFDQIHRLVEEIASLHGDDATVRRLCRLLDEIKGGAGSIGLTSIGESAGVMGTLARRGGGLQMKVRGLREGFVGLKINFEGALRAAKTPEPEGSGAPPTASP